MRSKFASFIYFTMHSYFLMGGGAHVKFFFFFLTFFFFFFLLWTILKIFLEFVTVLHLFMFWFFGQEACETLAP